MFALVGIKVGIKVSGNVVDLNGTAPNRLNIKNNVKSMTFKKFPSSFEMRLNDFKRLFERYSLIISSGQK